MNRRFAALWEAERLSEVLPKIELHPRLLQLVRAPFVRRAGGLLLEPLVANATGPESFQDVTGYEAFVNKFHVDDFIDEAGSSDRERLRILIQQGTKAAIELSERLKKEGGFRVFLSLDADLPTMTLRFFGLREGEQWGEDDPDAFQLEEVLLIDTIQTSANRP